MSVSAVSAEKAVEYCEGSGRDAGVSFVDESTGKCEATGVELGQLTLDEEERERIGEGRQYERKSSYFTLSVF